MGHRFCTRGRCKGIGRGFLRGDHGGAPWACPANRLAMLGGIGDSNPTWRAPRRDQKGDISSEASRRFPLSRQDQSAAGDGVEVSIRLTERLFVECAFRGVLQKGCGPEIGYAGEMEDSISMRFSKDRGLS